MIDINIIMSTPVPAAVPRRTNPNGQHRQELKECDKKAERRVVRCTIVAHEARKISVYMSTSSLDTL